MAVTAKDLVMQYGGLAPAAHAVAVGVDTSWRPDDWMQWPENFRSLILFYQHAHLEARFYGTGVLAGGRP